MVDISNLTQALAVANTTDTATFENSVLVVALIDDVTTIVEELEVTKQWYQLATVPLSMIQTYFEGFAAQLAEHEFPTDKETKASELAKKNAEEAEAIYDKLKVMAEALGAAVASREELIALTLGLSQGTKDLVAMIKHVQNN